MRLWHIDLISILPTQQLLGQWRECTLIAKLIHTCGTPNHILVNKVINYPMEHFATYCYNVYWYMKKQGFAPSPFTKSTIETYLGMKLAPYMDSDMVFPNWHNDRYLIQCLTNLEEKYDCGGIPEDEWVPIENKINYIL